MHVAQLRDRYEELEAKDANVAAIGMGLIPMAANFRDEHDIPFPLLVDQRRETHRAFELQRGRLQDLVGPKQVARGIKAFVTGTSAGRPAPKQDVRQLGGSLVVAPGGKILHRHVAESSDDNATVDELLGALP